MIKWAVYNARAGGWLVDTGVGGTYSWDVDQAQWFDSMDIEGVRTALRACDLLDNESFPHFQIVRVK